MPIDPTADQIAAATDCILRAVDSHRINGVVSIRTDDTVIFEGAFGLSSLEYRILNTADTKFLLGSNTKLFTAVAIMQLVESGELLLESPLYHFFPEHRDLIDPEVTVRHLLSHTAGVVNFWDLDCFDGDIQMIEISNDRLIHILLRNSSAEVGHFAYGNSGYYLLGLAIERTTGISYTEYITKYILDVLGMTDSGVYDQESVIEGLATGYRLKGSDLIAAPYYEMRKLYACGGVYSTIGDVNKWLKGLLENRVLSSGSFQQICTPVDSNYGFGCRVHEAAGMRWICHDGYVKGHYSHIRLYPSVGLRMQILRNSSALSSESQDEVNPGDVCSDVAEAIGVPASK